MKLKKEGDRITFRTKDKGLVHDEIDMIDLDCGYATYRVAELHNFTEHDVDATDWVPDEFLVEEIKMHNPERLP